MLLRIAVAGLSVTALAACAVNQTVDRDTRSRYDQQALRMAGGPVAIVSDACVLRDEVGEDFVLLNQSRTTSKAMLRQVSNRLLQRGLNVTKQVSPFLCGTLKPDEIGDFKVVESRYVPAVSSALPVIEDLAAQSNPALAQAYRDLLSRANEAKLPNFVQQGQPEQSTLELPADSLHLLKSELGVTSVWVILMNAAEVSAGKSIGVGLLTGLLTAGASGGAAIGVGFSKSGHRQQAVLVDLDRAEIVWKKASGILPGASSNTLHTEAWAQEMLSPFLIIVGMPFEAGQIAVVDAPAQVAGTQFPPAKVIPAVSTLTPTPARQTTQLIEPARSDANARTWVLTDAVYLLSNPMMHGTVNGLVPAGVVLNIAGVAHNTSGEWWYVTAHEYKGWVQALDQMKN